MAAEAFIQCRVTAEMKALVRTLAERRQISESALLKQLLEVVVQAAALQDLPDVGARHKPNRDARLYVRLDPDDRAALADRAAARGMRSATYVSVLLRSHLRKLTPIPKEELVVLKGAVAELRAIGINLNQMARSMNQGGEATPGWPEVQAMLKVAAGLRDHFKALLIANEKSWEQGYAEDTH